MRSSFIFALIAAAGLLDAPTMTNAINLETLAKEKSAAQTEVKTVAQTSDGPTNGEMAEDEKDTLI